MLYYNCTQGGQPGCHAVPSHTRAPVTGTLCLCLPTSTLSVDQPPLGVSPHFPSPASFPQLSCCVRTQPWPAAFRPPTCWYGSSCAPQVRAAACRLCCSPRQTNATTCAPRFVLRAQPLPALLPSAALLLPLQVCAASGRYGTGCIAFASILSQFMNQCRCKVSSPQRHGAA